MPKSSKPMPDLQLTLQKLSQVDTQQLAVQNRPAVSDVVAFCLAVAFVSASLGIWIFPTADFGMLLIKLITSIVLMGIGGLFWLWVSMQRRKLKRVH